MFRFIKSGGIVIVLCFALSPVSARMVTLEGNPFPHSITVPEELDSWRPEKREYRDSDIDLVLFSRNFCQGDAVYWEFMPVKFDRALTLLSISVEGREIPASSRDWGYRGFFAINPDRKPGEMHIRLRYRTGMRQEFIDLIIKTGDSNFVFSRTPLDLGKHSDVDYQEAPENREFIRICSEKKKKAFSTMGPDLIVSRFSHPRDMHYITSQFWSRRVYMQYRFVKGKKVILPNRIKTHAGIDLRGSTGEPVFSIADGTVNLAETLFYEGNMVIIDHGNRIFSYYMHMDGVNVKEGERVRAGSQIGRVGSTGISTASHLHVSFMIDGVQVNPLSMLFLPVRD